MDEKATCAKISQVQQEGERTVKRQIKIYNLDLIISVGYRVNSKQGTAFRIWANKIIKDHLVKGHTINEKRLLELQKTIKLVNRTIQGLGSDDQTKGIFEVLSEFSNALDILDDYDHQRLSLSDTPIQATFRISYDEAKYAVDELKKRFGGSSLFGNEKDQSFKGSISAIDQTFDGIELYRSLEEKAAHLLYFVVKNHSFSDGNKRIAAWLFIWYLEKNKSLYFPDGTKRISENALVALTLLIAESKPEEKQMMINVVVNLINRS
ncbi:MAG: virulence protein RhuM/Fic/DOC family protein [Algoriphagus sp.]|uniref:virulence protein RhuM/Fic/DOC family protein n=1 Tax=Algoriphagus sp. TaxID=1872435 RepID=UPI00261C35BD|nr:virulence protein RhuM/Fic/DOC family protein [Algoriphagus sp.]MDG1278196.1 virulence protein RhuM/Fic/DOC family protein [Algoriphagus sp.]